MFYPQEHLSIALPTADSKQPEEVGTGQQSMQ